MSHTARRLLLALALCGGPLPADEQPAAAAPQKPVGDADIDRAAAELSDPRFETREAAGKLLWRAGPRAAVALRRVAAGRSAEAAGRARALLDRIDLGLTPETSPRLAELAQRYRSAADRGQAAVELMEWGQPGLKILRTLLDREEDNNVADAIAARLRASAGASLNRALLAGDTDAAAELLELSLADRSPAGAADLAALLSVSGRLDPLIARYERLREKPPASPGRFASPRRVAEILAHLYRAKGDFAKARRSAADATDGTELKDWVAWGAGDWAGLDDAGFFSEELSNPAARLGVKAAYQRLAGRDEKLERTVNELRRSLADAGDDQDSARAAAAGLLLNDRPEYALDELVKSKADPSLTIELLAVQMRYRDALEYFDRVTAEPGGLKTEDLRSAKARRARLLHGVGRRDEAVKAFDGLAGEFANAGDIRFGKEVMRAELRCGQREKAFEHAAAFLDRLAHLGSEYAYSELLEPLFGREKAAEAGAWFHFYREAEAPGVAAKPGEAQPRPPGLERMRKVEAAVNAPTAAHAADAARLLDRADGWRVDEQATGYYAAATLLNALGRHADARAALRRYADRLTGRGVSVPPEAFIRQGDSALLAQEYKEAARLYAEAETLSGGRNALPVYLHGWALSQAGQSEEGRKLMDRARCLSMAQGSDRDKLAEALVRRGLTAAARRERELALNAGWFEPTEAYRAGNLYNHLAREAAAKKDYRKAADLAQRSVVSCLRTGATFVEPSAYLVVPQNVHQLRARAMIAEGKTDDALKLAREQLETLPGHQDLVNLLVPELDRAKRKADADALYAQARAPYDRALKDHPEAHWVLNSLAWLSANCKRDLDEALKQALKATELAPNTTSYMDTLAEVHFRRGDKAQAVSVMQQCLKLEPRNSYFKKQLERFQAGDRDSEHPDEDDD